MTAEPIAGTDFIAKWEAKEIAEIVMVAVHQGKFYVFTKGPTQGGGDEEQKVYVVSP